MFKGLTSHKSKELHGSCQGKSPHSSHAEMFCAECRVDFGNMHFVLGFSIPQVTLSILAINTTV